MFKKKKDMLMDVDGPVNDVGPTSKLETGGNSDEDKQRKKRMCS